MKRSNLYIENFMTEETFWKLVDESGTHGSDPGLRNQAIAERLHQLDEAERAQFGQVYHTLDCAAYRWDLWGAAYLINGGCSDDGFDYFRAWLISQGRAVYEAAMSDPDSLADHLGGGGDEYENEDFLGLAREALGDATISGFPGEPAGEEWDFDDDAEMQRHLPRLIRGMDSGSEEPTAEFDSGAVEARIRELTLGFMRSDEFSTMFSEIHPGKLQVNIVKGMGLFNKGIREVAGSLAARRKLSSPELKARYVRMAETAPIVFAHIVMANTAAIKDGQPAPALVVLAWGENGMELMAEAREILGKVHFGLQESERERQLAELIEDEEYHFGRRRPLPSWLAADQEAYAADLWISTEALDNERLRMEVIVCFGETGHEGMTMAIPGRFVQQAIRENDPSRQPPPLPQTSGPPPLPTRPNPPPLPPR